MGIINRITVIRKDTIDPKLPNQIIREDLINPRGLTTNGLIIDVTIDLNKVFKQVLTELGRPIPPPMITKGLIDTGCSITSIDQSIAESLNLPSQGKVKVYTAAGPSTSYAYEVGIFFGPLLEGRPSWRVHSARLSNPQFKVLIGRDIMESWAITYNGSFGYFSISD
jgi:hypothetical protein